MDKNNEQEFNGLRFLCKHYNKYLYQCNKCGAKQVFTKEEIEKETQTCKLCNLSNPLNTNKIIGELDLAKAIESRENNFSLRAGTFVRSNLNYNGRPGDRIWDLVIKYNISRIENAPTGGVIKAAPHDAMLYCPRCNYHIRYSKAYSENGGYKCPNCSKVIDKINKDLEEFQQAYSKHSETIKKNRAEKIKNMYKQSQVTEDNDKKKQTKKIQPISRVKSQMDKINLNDNSKISTYINAFNINNPELVVEDIEKVKGTVKLKTVCNICGIENTVKVSKNAQKIECEGCKELKQNLNFIGKYNRNWVGLTKNNLVIEEQNGLSCTVRCKMCKSVKENVRLYDILNSKAYCSCIYSNLDDMYYCDKCGKPLSIKLSSLITVADNSQEITCNNCKEPSGVVYQEVINYQSASDLKSTTCNRLNISIKEYKNSVITTDNIIKDKDCIYVGIDGKEYFRCRCIDHNTDMILSEAEIQMFNHKECYDSRQVLLEKLQPSKLRI